MANNSGSDGAEPWRELAETAVERLGILNRVAFGLPLELAPQSRFAAAGLDQQRLTLAADAARDAEGELDRARATIDPILHQAHARFIEASFVASPFTTIVANARLSMAEATAFALVVACELDTRLGRLVAVIQGESHRNRINLQTMSQLLSPLDASAVVAVGIGSGLRRCAFIEVLEEGPWAMHSVAVHPSVLWALVGDDAVDPALPVGCTIAVDPDGSADGDGLVVVTGRDRVRRREEAVRRLAGSRFLVAAPPATTEVWETLVREATLSGTGIIIELDDTGVSADARRWVARADHLAWALTSKRELTLEAMPPRPWVEYHAEDSEPGDEEWEATIGDASLRGRHRLTAEQLELVSKAYTARHGDIDAAVRRLVAGNLEQLAHRVRPSRTWSDIVLSNDRQEQLLGIVHRYRHSSTVYDEWGFSALPSRGLVALFAGPSGTGKTLAAEIVAGELGLDMFKLDLSSVVSKYIGETEKNLEQIFDAAGTGNVVLFFDEADSLFGKRSEVKDARDRYANIEVSYLLQRLERYDGVVVLATNFEKNIDEAFLRRIHSRIEFAIPAAPERLTIWQRNIPGSAPTEDLDLDALASQFEMSGGSIRNVAIHAAFSAAALGRPISTELAVLSIAREYRKIGRLLKQEQFGQFYPIVTRQE